MEGSALKRKLRLTLLAAAASATTLTASAVALSPAEDASRAAETSRNLIILIGDGMGPAQVTAARLYLMHRRGVRDLALDSIYVGQATTYADRGEDSGSVVSGVVTDSASAGTAFATGHKTYNAAISVSNEDVAKPLGSVVEAAERAGKATGLVTTARITHATPAVFAAHVRHRDNENAIAAQYLESGVDVLLGGGRDFFISKQDGGKRPDRTLLPDFQAAGYRLVTDKAGLEALPADTDKVLGLFSSSHIPYVSDRPASVPDLATMTRRALSFLSRDPDGFVLMVEGGRIDHAGHANDFPTMLRETLEFDEAVRVALDFAKKDGRTSVVVTADHETGGLSLSRDNIYELNIELWDRQNRSSEAIAARLKAAKTAEDVRAIVADNTWIRDLSDEEAAFILRGDGSSYGREGAYNAVVSKRLLIGWSGHGHSGVDVGVWAYGPIAELVKGQIDNTRIALASAESIGVDLARTTAELQARYLYPKFKIDRDGRVLFPARPLAESFGARVTWDEARSTVVLTLGDRTLEVSAASGQARLDGRDLGPFGRLDDGKLYLTLSAFSELTNRPLKWDPLSERIVLSEVR